MLPEEANLFVIKAYDYNIRQGLLWDITLNGGLRISETLNICPCDINYIENKIKIKTLKRKKEYKVDLLFPAKTILICKKIINHIIISSEDKLFPYTRQWCWKCFKKILLKAGLSDKYSPHALRHTHGIVISEITKGNTVSIAKRLRHSNLNYVGRYTHLTDKIQEEIIKGIENYKYKNNK